MKIGSVAALARYPFKSMRGEKLTKAEVGTSGFAGDRRFALIDVETGKIVSAKLPRYWRKMLDYKAYCHHEETGKSYAVDPDGSEYEIAAGEFEAVMSKALGREVKLVIQRPAGASLDRADPDAVADHGFTDEVEATVLELGMAAPEGGFFDFAPVHLIASCSLDEVAKVTLSGERDTTRFRPNLVIDCPDATAFVENSWAGGTLTLGSVTLQVILPSPRCAVPTLSHGDLQPDRKLTRNISEMNRVQILDLGLLPCLGAYAGVVEPGSISIGDTVSFSPAD